MEVSISKCAQIAQSLNEFRLKLIIKWKPEYEIDSVLDC